MKKILIGLVLMFQAHADIPAGPGKATEGAWRYTFQNADPAECQACVKTHSACILTIMSAPAIVMEDVTACDELEHKCLVTNECRNHE
jgi:hypothetical protein